MVGLDPKTLDGVNKIGSPWLETPGSVEKHTHIHTTCPNIK